MNKNKWKTAISMKTSVSDDVFEKFYFLKFSFFILRCIEFQFFFFFFFGQIELKSILKFRFSNKNSLKF